MTWCQKGYIIIVLTRSQSKGILNGNRIKFEMEEFEMEEANMSKKIVQTAGKALGNCIKNFFVREYRNERII